MSKPEPTRKAPTPKSPPTVSVVSFRLPLDLLGRARRAAYWDRLALVDLVEAGLERVLEELEGERGGPYPEIPGGRLRPGKKPGPKPNLG